MTQFEQFARDFFKNSKYGEREGQIIRICAGGDIDLDYFRTETDVKKDRLGKISVNDFSKCVNFFSELRRKHQAIVKSLEDNGAFGYHNTYIKISVQVRNTIRMLEKRALKSLFAWRTVLSKQRRANNMKNYKGSYKLYFYSFEVETENNTLSLHFQDKDDSEYSELVDQLKYGDYYVLDSATLTSFSYQLISHLPSSKEKRNGKNMKSYDPDDFFDILLFDQMDLEQDRVNDAKDEFKNSSDKTLFQIYEDADNVLPQITLAQFVKKNLFRKIEGEGEEVGKDLMKEKGKILRRLREMREAEKK